MSNSFDLSRRNALKLTSLAPLMLSGGLMGGLTRAAFAQTASATDYRALVAIFMFGGNDGNNVLIPMDAAGYPANGSGGSDHGWGNHHLVLGGAVKGKQLYGTFPTLRVNGPDNTSGGRWIPTTATEQYAAALGSGFGL